MRGVEPPRFLVCVWIVFPVTPVPETILKNELYFVCFSSHMYKMWSVGGNITFLSVPVSMPLISSFAHIWVWYRTLGPYWLGLLYAIYSRFHIITSDFYSSVSFSSNIRFEVFFLFARCLYISLRHSNVVIICVCHLDLSCDLFS